MCLPPLRLTHRSLLFYLYQSYAHPQDLHSFPTRRSSDLHHRHAPHDRRSPAHGGAADGSRDRDVERLDRKSTRLNSSHSQISYAVFCLKKKKRRIRDERMCLVSTSATRVR